MSTAKLPILNPNELDLWKMRIEQYFLMTDYSLWEVILNGDSPAPTGVIEGVLQPIAPTTADQRLARKNELKARGTLLMALPDKHQLKFNTHKDAKTLMEAIEKRFGENTKTKKVQKTLLKQQYEKFTGFSSESLDQIHDRLQKLISQLEIIRVSLSQEDINLKFLRSLHTEWRTHTLIWRNKTDLEEQSLDDLFNSLKIYEAEVKSSSSASTSNQNIAFVSASNTDSTNEPVSAAASVFTVSAKIHVSALPNVDTLSNVVIYSFFASQSTSPQLDNDDLKKINADDLEEMDLKWKMAMKGHFARECRSPKDTRRNGAAEPQRRNVPVDTSTLNALVSQCDGVGNYDWSFQAAEEPTNYALMAFTSLSSSSNNELWDNALVVLRQNLEKVEQEGDHLKLKLEKFQTSSKNLSELLASQTNDKTEDESETKISQNVPSFVQPTEQVKSPRPSVLHVETSIPTANPKTAIPKPTSNSNRGNRKACFVCKSLDHLIKDCDYHEKKMAQTNARNHAPRGNHHHYARMSLLNPLRHVVPSAVVPKSKLVPINATRPITVVVPKIHVTRPRQDKLVVTKPNSPPRRHISHSPSLKASNFPRKLLLLRLPWLMLLSGNPQNAFKDKGVIDSGCSRHMIGNMSYLSYFEELDGGYVAFGRNPKGGKISGKDKNQVLLRVPRENNMYNVDLKNIVPSGDLTCLFAKATLDESNLWDKRLGHINFKTMNKLVKGNLVRGLPSKVFENDHTCVACKKGKQHRASYKTKPVRSVNQPLQRLHMDLFGPTFVKSLNKKSYCLVVTDDYSRFTWVFFLATKDETSPILKTFIIGLENQLSLKVKLIRSDNGTEFKNNDLN
nr:ribonuclease H-like domain-containing protein [Tanacetum cinerariifolium]